MKEIIRNLLSESNSDLSIGLFDIWHFLYLFIIFGACITLACLFHNKSRDAKNKLLRVLAYLVIGLYVADFFLMPLSDSYNRISIDKLPFHICTLMGVMAQFAQFNKRFSKVKHVIVTLSIAASLMWMCYPGSALGGQPPFCYIIFQTFMYHGVLFAWGFLNLALGEVTLNVDKIWHNLCGILLIQIWAALGNSLYDDQNWFFLANSIFDFIPDAAMPPVVTACVFGVCIVIYGIYYAAIAIQKNIQALHSQDKMHHVA
jgi:hypothetical protein